nr:RNA-directed DNA polymerase, eukaryota, reverse transcriptase zinc-binding domain protein [Tanacetum cinerariifolium]
LSALASSFGRPILMDTMTATMRHTGNGNVDYARVLTEMDSEKEFKNEIETQYRDNKNIVKGVKKFRPNNVSNQGQQKEWKNAPSFKKQGYRRKKFDDTGNMEVNKERLKSSNAAEKRRPLKEKEMEELRKSGKSQDVQDIDTREILFHKKHNDAEVNYMVRNVTDAEIKEALFDIDDSKARGPNGFTVAFFKKSWSIIGRDIYFAVQNPSTATEFKPIACCNVLYKCISKVITNRIKPSLRCLVSYNQSAFIPDRLRRKKTFSAILDVKLSSYPMFALRMTYWLCVMGILLLSCVINDINSLLKRFLWNQGKSAKGKAKMAWENIHRPKIKGGLRPKHLQVWNEAMLAKHIWDIAIKKTPLDRLRRKKTFSAILDVKLSSYPMFALRMTYWLCVMGILLLCKSAKGKEKMAWENICRPKIKGGLRPKHLQVWNEAMLAKHIWDIAIKKTPSRLYGNMKVCGMLRDGKWCWPDDWYEKFPNITIIEEPKINTLCADKIVWKTNDREWDDFSVRKANSILCTNTPDVTWWNMMKIKAFKFSNFMTDKKEFLLIVKDQWNKEIDGYHMYKAMKKLKNLKSPLNKLGWNKGKNQDVQDIDTKEILFHKKHNDAEVDYMVRNITDAEIKEALFDINDSKAPGPNGFTVAFFKKSWSIIGRDIYFAVK